MAGYFLVLNTGSSSIKFAGFDSVSLMRQFSGVIDYRGSGDDANFTAKLGEQRFQQTVSMLNSEDGKALPVKPIFDWVGQQAADHTLIAIGHRVVHGGEAFSEPVLIDDQVIATIEECVKFAPLHNPSNLRGIQQSRHYFPSVPQVGIFDTAFHQSLPQHAYLYA